MFVEIKTVHNLRACNCKIITKISFRYPHIVVSDGALIHDFKFQRNWYNILACASFEFLLK